MEGMCANMNLDFEIQENGLYDEIGKEMEREYGKVERVVVWRKEQGGGDDVFVKFTAEVSALRCVNAMGACEFAGNKVRARFFAADAFEKGEFA